MNDDYHFGYQHVAKEEKVNRVQSVFSSVAQQYDLMNDLMSAGLHRFWKKRAVRLAHIHRHHHVLDLAAGTGDLTCEIKQRLDDSGRVIAADINADMLQHARSRLFDQGYTDTPCLQLDAEKLPFAANSFDRVTIAFGLRNVADPQSALHAINRVLKPGGLLLILEFSKLNSATMQALYDQYSFQVLPRLGQCVAGDSESYRYLAESIRMHPDQPALLAMMQQADFHLCQYYNLTGGIVAIHRGYKP